MPEERTKLRQEEVSEVDQSSFDKPVKKIDLFDTSYLKDDLKSRSIRGGAYTFISQACKFILRTGSKILLARLLTPADFGLIAMVTTLTKFADMFKDLGLSRATVQRKDINQNQISALFWINMAVGVFIAAIVALSAPFIADFYGHKELKIITVALSFAFVFSGLSIQHHALLQRHMRFFVIGIVDVLSTAISVLCAVAAAYYGAGYWSLVILHVSFSLFVTLGLWLAVRWRPGLPKRDKDIKEMLGFGGNIAGFRIVNYFSRNLDNVLIGKLCSPAILGFYTNAYSLLMLPINQIRDPINYVATSTLSRIQDDHKRFVSYYSKLVLIVSFVSMPLVVYLGICSRNIIYLLLGEKWIPASSIFQILAVTAFIQPSSSTLGVVMLSLGQSRRFLRYGLFSGIAIVTSFFIGIKWGAKGVAGAYAIVTYLILFPSLWYCFRKTPVSLALFFKSIFRPLIASLIMGLVTFTAYRFMRDMYDIVVILSCFVIGLIVYFLVWILMPGGLSTLKDLYGWVVVLFSRQKEKTK